MKIDYRVMRLRVRTNSVNHPLLTSCSTAMGSKEFADFLVNCTEQYLAYRSSPPQLMQALNSASQIEVPSGIRSASADAAAAVAAPVAPADLAAPPAPESQELDAIFTHGQLDEFLKGPPPRDT